VSPICLQRGHPSLLTIFPLSGCCQQERLGRSKKSHNFSNSQAHKMPFQISLFGHYLNRNPNFLSGQQIAHRYRSDSTVLIYLWRMPSETEYTSSNTKSQQPTFLMSPYFVAYFKNGNPSNLVFRTVPQKPLSLIKEGID